ncbi:MAG: 2-iminoacetate synthase ThiH [Leptospiraceae bacterium]|nr:2-iminoacetate synthase ThiH [Leptospiraceae bacterium]MCP5511433.1 2-iminoacetate synthase ThiH [Leptospiraceae bacterium]
MNTENFSEVFALHRFSEAVEEVNSRTPGDVEVTLHSISSGRKLNFSDFLSLISPSADSYLEELAIHSKEITLERFGKAIQLYTPLYLSNECRSSCLYCGFSFENRIPRKTLSEEELRREAEILKDLGFRHILVLTGEDYSKTPLKYIKRSIEILKEYFSSVSIEIYPMKEEDYSELISAGADGLALYQETYHPDTYKEYHIRGVKKDMIFRLDGPDRGGRAGFRKIGIGALLGLSAPLGEMYFLGLHASHLLGKYWRSQIQISLPRMRPAKGEFSKVIRVNDREFARFVFAFRIYFRDTGIVLSTRESAEFRDNLLGLGITQMSAGSKTEPGGYQGLDTLEQFEIEDKRSLEEVMEMIRNRGYDPVLKDFDKAIL